jgi:predicted pyridoxine 5'-phosphate oxidase superfamily flavin-nucleotide-binding protein
MRTRFFSTAFTPSVQAEQARHGSRAAYARLAASDEPDAAGLTEAEAGFIAARDSFYLGTVSETGWPHVQHRGGPAGFVHVLDPLTLAWADFSGNRQYVSIGNTAVNERVALLFMDYPGQQRLKVLGRLDSVEIGERPDFRPQLEMTGYRGRIEHAIQVRVEGFDWNCPQHITPRFTADQVEVAVAPLRREIEALNARLQAAAAKP